MLPLVLSSDSHVFEPPDLWQTRIDVAFRDRAPRIERIDDGDHVVVEADQILSGIGLISNAARGSTPPRRSPPRGALKTCSAAGTTPGSILRTWRSMGWPVKFSIPRKILRPLRVPCRELV